MPNVTEFIPELVGLGVDAVICLLLYKGLHVTSKVLQDLSSATPIEIEDDVKVQIERSSASIINKETSSVIIPYAVIRGTVNPLGKVISSTYSSEQLKGVIQKVVLREHKCHRSGTGFWIDTKRVLHEFTNDAPFCLSSPKSQSVFSLIKPHVEVQDWSDAARVDLDTVYDQLETHSAGLGSHILGWLQGDMQKGVQTTELMLTSGTNLTAVGELVSGPAGIKIQPPSDGRPFYMVRNSLSSLIKDVEAELTTLKVFLGIFSGVGTFILLWSAVKYYNKTRGARATRANLDRLATIRTERREREGRGERGDVPEALQCVICLTAEREVILNCGHVCVCADCADTLLTGGHNCPVCRARILTVSPAFVS